VINLSLSLKWPKVAIMAALQFAKSMFKSGSSNGKKGDENALVTVNRCSKSVDRQSP